MDSSEKLMSKPTDYEQAAIELEQATKMLRKKRLAWERYEQSLHDLKEAEKAKRQYEKSRIRSGSIQLAATRIAKNTVKALLNSTTPQPKRRPKKKGVNRL